MSQQNTLAELDAQIAAVRGNLRTLVEQTASAGGAADEELYANQIEEQPVLFDELSKRRAAINS